MVTKSLNKYDSMRGRLTQSGVKQFASEMINYLDTDVAPDLKTRSVMDHTLGMLSQIWDLAHRQDVPAVNGTTMEYNI